MSEIVVPRKTYLKVWATLLMLLALTVAVAYLHLGWANPAAALGIAAIKATIIILYFMHVRYSPRLVWVFAAAGVFWFGIMFVLTITDYFTRGYLPVPTIW